MIERGVRATELKERLIVERLEESYNEFGGLNEKWDKLMSLRAEIKAVVLGVADISSFKVETREDITIDTYNVRTYYRPSIRRTDRVVYNGEVYAIKGLRHVREVNTTFLVIKHENL